MSDEKRTFLRIAAHVKGHARFLESTDEPPLFREAPASGNGPITIEAEGVSDGLLALLSTINAKLDMLISMQSRENLTDDFPIRVDATEISGAGLRFHADRELEEGAAMEVVLVLNQFPLRMAGAVGRVLRQHQSDGRTAYVMDFNRIRERDLETIVQFVFQTQRDEIRGKKWD